MNFSIFDHVSLTEDPIRYKAEVRMCSEKFTGGWLHQDNDLKFESWALNFIFYKSRDEDGGGLRLSTIHGQNIIEISKLIIDGKNDIFKA